MAAVTNYYKHDALKQYIFSSYSPANQKSKISLIGLKQKCQHSFLEMLEENKCIPYLFQLPETSCIPWLLATPSIFQDSSSITLTSAPVVTSPSVTLISSLPLIGIILRMLMIQLGPPDNPGSHPYIRILNLHLQCSLCYGR